MNDVLIRKPVIIVGSPRSGTSLLLTILNASTHLWSLYRETIEIWQNYYKITKKEFKNDVLGESDLDDISKDFLLNEFHKYSFNNRLIGNWTNRYFFKKPVLDWKPPVLLQTIANLNIIYKKLFVHEYRLVEKSPKNCFRIPFINKLFNDCKFIFLKRDGRSNINSLIEGWRSHGRYLRPEVSNIMLNIKGCDDTKWKFVLPPEWENYKNKSLEEVCAFQWVSSNRAAIDSLQLIDNNRKYFISYEELVERPYETIHNLCNFIHIPFDKELKMVVKKMPVVNYVTRPHKDKWKKNIDLIKNTYPTIEPMMKELGYSL